MTCNFPLQAYRPLSAPRQVGASPLADRFEKKGSLSFKPTGGEKVLLPCNKCAGCAKSRAQEWTTRLVHERAMHEQAVFLTLTYDDDHIQNTYPPHIRPVQLFLKRLRKQYGKGISYYAASELGDKTARFHHHLILFGRDFSPKRELGQRYWESDELNKIWGMGKVLCGEADEGAIAYVAGYTLKKIGQHVPFPAVMSRRPAIGRRFVERYGVQQALARRAVISGRPVPVPSRYLHWLEAEGFDTSNLKYHRQVEASAAASVRMLATTPTAPYSREYNLQRGASLRGDKAC